jgi:peptide/nickel transport system substrate-binding protein
MLYWSSLLLERETGELRRELAQTRDELQRIKVEFRRPVVIQQEIVEAEVEALPTLFEEDPFYAETLPAMLGPDFSPVGTLREATIGKPANLHPFSNWHQVTVPLRLCSTSVGRTLFGHYERFAANVAERVEERAPGEYWVFLRDGVFWAPLEPSHFPKGFALAKRFKQRHQLTAHDFKFHFDAIMNPFVGEGGAAAQRNYIGDIEAFEVIDDLTFVVRWRKEKGMVKYAARAITMGLQPLASWVYQFYADGSPIIETEDYRTNSVWAQAFSQHWAQNVIPSCGPWLFDGWVDGEIRLKRNGDYFTPYDALSSAMLITFKESPDGIWQDFKSMGCDTFESRVAPEKLAELGQFVATRTYQNQAAQGSGIEKLEFLDRSFRYIGWNQANPLFASKRVRQALTMAINREQLITQALNGMGVETTGPLYPLDPAYDPTLQAWPFDPVEARRLLAEEGWADHDGDGILDKMIDGQRVKFSFALTYYVKSTNLRVNVDFIATALREVGIECKPRGVDIADLSHTFEGKDFDAICLAWGLGSPPSDPRQIWHSQGAKEKGSSNAIGFASAEADALIEALHYEYDLDERLKLYHRFHRILHDEQPYTFLFVPKQSFLYREYVQNVFVPSERQDLVPGATVTEPASSIFWIKHDAVDA